MSLKLTSNVPLRHIEKQGSTTTSYATDYLWQFWDWLSTPPPDQTSIFDPARCQVLSYHVDEQVA